MRYNMVALYVKRIKEGLMTVDEVPKLWRDKVQAELDKENSQKKL